MKFNKIRQLVSAITENVIVNTKKEGNFKMLPRITQGSTGLFFCNKFQFALSSESLQKVEGLEAYYKLLGPKGNYIWQLRYLLIELLNKNEAPSDVFKISVDHDERIIKHFGEESVEYREHIKYLLQFQENRYEECYTERMRTVEKLIEKYPNSKIFRHEPMFLHVKMHIANDLFRINKLNEGMKKMREYLECPMFKMSEPEEKMHGELAAKGMMLPYIRQVEPENFEKILSSMKSLVESDFLMKQKDEAVRYFSAYYYAENVLLYEQANELEKAREAGLKVVENTLQAEKKTNKFLWINFTALTSSFSKLEMKKELILLLENLLDYAYEKKIMYHSSDRYNFMLESLYNADSNLKGVERCKERAQFFKGEQKSKDQRTEQSQESILDRLNFYESITFSSQALSADDLSKYYQLISKLGSILETETKENLTKDDLEYLSKHLKKMTSKGCQMIEKGHPNLLQKKQNIFEKLIDIQLLLEDGN